MTALYLLVPAVVVSIAFQFAKRQWKGLDELSGLVKQFVVVTGTIGAAILWSKLGLPVPGEIASMRDAALIGLIQGLAALGAHGVKAQVTKPAA